MLIKRTKKNSFLRALTVVVIMASTIGLKADSMEQENNFLIEPGKTERKNRRVSFEDLQQADSVTDAREKIKRENRLGLSEIQHQTNFVTYVRQKDWGKIREQMRHEHYKQRLDEIQQQASILMDSMLKDLESELDSKIKDLESGQDSKIKDLESELDTMTKDIESQKKEMLPENYEQSAIEIKLQKESHSLKKPNKNKNPNKESAQEFREQQIKAYKILMQKRLDTARMNGHYMDLILTYKLNPDIEIARLHEAFHEYELAASDQERFTILKDYLASIPSYEI